MHHARPRTPAFTLIELLVVIAIIAILIGILIPSLATARGMGKQVLCANHQRQIFSGISSYTTDFKDFHHAKRLNYGARFSRINASGPYESNNLRLLRPYLPNFTEDGTGTDFAYWGAIYDSYFDITVDPSWYVARMPWVSMDNPPFPGWKMWRCPSAKKMDPYPNGTQWNPDHFYQSYGFNGVEAYPNNGTLPPRGATWWRRQYVPAYGRIVSVPTRMSEIIQPSALLIFQDAFEHMIDANGDTLNDLTQYNPDIEGGNPAFFNWQKEYFRHNAGCNTTWGDGHVRAIGVVQLNESLPWYIVPRGQ